MRYDLSKSYDKQKAKEYLSKLSESDSKAELKKISPRRSTSQNSYLHVLFNLWANEFGYTIDETKTLVKTALGYTYKAKSDTPIYSNGMPNPFDLNVLKKTSEMDTKELTTFIEKFRDWSAMTCELYLPSSEEFLEERIYFENLLEK